LQDIRAGAFDTGIPKQGQGTFLKLVINVLGYAAKHIAGALKKKGARVVRTETFYVLGKEGPVQEGEIERATNWVKSLLD